MATVAHALTTKEKVKEPLGISDSASDTLIDSIISGTTDWIESYCGGRRFKSTAYSNKIFDSKGGDALFLPQYPISTVSALEYRGGTWSTPIWTAFNANDYLLYGDRGYIQFSTRYNAYPQYFRVSYTAGFLIDFGRELDTTYHTLPFDVTQAATEIAVKSYERRLAQGKVSESVEGQSVTWAVNQDVSPEQMKVLNRYRRS